MERQRPELSISFSVSLSDFDICSNLIAARIKRRQMNKSIVLGALFAIIALGYMGFSYFGQHRQQPQLYLLCLVLLGVGVYNILYYPLLFDKAITKKNRRLYENGAYFKEPVTLDFYKDYLIEHSAKGENRVMWQTILSMMESPLVYFLRISEQNGIIIPKSQLDTVTKDMLDAYLKETLHQFGKDIVAVD